MKRLYTYLFAILLLAAVTALPSHAQYLSTKYASSKKYMVGVRGGLNFSNYLGKNFSNGNRKMRGLAGVYLKYNVAPQFAIQPEVNMSWMGAKFNAQSFAYFNDHNAAGNVNILETHLQIPVLAKYQIRTQSGIEPNIFAGPVASFPIYDKYKYSAASNSTASVPGKGKLKDINLNQRSSQFGMQFGAGLQFSGLSLDARYYLGLTHAFKNSVNEKILRNNAIMVTLGIGI
ncbi:MAG TPA: porin family protein [Balneolaceae bacterium]|nr:porin family protein [Balneolaceae bacterium]